MNSIYHQALGNDFHRLHPQLQSRFGFTSHHHLACIGQGTMTRILPAPAWARPFLALGTFRHILFPDSGRNIPFTLQNYAYIDHAGREAMTWIRTFHFPTRIRRFDAYMHFDPRQHCIIDRLGTHQHLTVPLHATVTPNGGIHFQSGPQRFTEGPLNFPIPRLLTAHASVHEWFDDATHQFRIHVKVQHPKGRTLFGYEGHFQIKWVPATNVPPHLEPRRLGLSTDDGFQVPATGAGERH